MSGLTCENKACGAEARKLYDEDGKKLCGKCKDLCNLSRRGNQKDVILSGNDEVGDGQFGEEDAYQAEYRLARLGGDDHLAATHRAIDYLRKTTRYAPCGECEGTGRIAHVMIEDKPARCPNCQGSGKVPEQLLDHNGGGEDGEYSDEEFLGPDTRITPEEEVSFNLMIRNKLKGMNKRTREHLVILCRAHGLDSFFDETTFELCNEITTAYPVDENGLVSSKKGDIATALGLKKKAGRSDTNLWRMTDQLKAAFVDLLK